ncbi:menaquinone-dependent protoporphyrinogen IX dehydrogenase [Pseudaeromonas sp. ZJS20]|uniref:menaquinone-dependent protoporphyrinogen IX dehydrogenase n=1 Tax=Pseudaeromonas aegiceratis TaxID=3153928 RepID=UPI00390C6AC1
MRVAVFYSSRNGQTRKILETLLRGQPDAQVEWYDLHQYPKKNLTKYDKVLIGASIRYGHFHPSLESFIQGHLEQLKAVDANLIGVCLTARKPEKATPKTNPYMRKLLARVAWHPQRAAVFAGALRYSQYNWWQTRIIQLIMKMTGGQTDTSQDVELTDWAAVEEFARQLWSR